MPTFIPAVMLPICSAFGSTENRAEPSTIRTTIDNTNEFSYMSTFDATVRSTYTRAYRTTFKNPI